MSSCFRNLQWLLKKKVLAREPSVDMFFSCTHFANLRNTIAVAMRCWQLDVERQLALDSRVRTDAVVTDEVVDHFGPRVYWGRLS